MTHLFRQGMAIAGGIVAALALFGVLIEFTDINNYNLFHIDVASGLPLYTPNSSYVTSRGCFINRVEVNNLGFHGPLVGDKTPKTFRILVVGGSYIAAEQVPIRAMYSTILQQELNARGGPYIYEVVPMGFDGNGTLKDVLYYANFGRVLRPDLVIHLETQNELITTDAPAYDAHGALVTITPLPAPRPLYDAARSLLRSSKFMINLYTRGQMLEEAIHEYLKKPLFFLPSPVPDMPDEKGAEAARWEVKDKLLTAFANMVHEDGAKLVLTTWVMSNAATSASMTDEEKAMQEELRRHIADIAESTGSSYLDLEDAALARGVAEDTPVIFSCDPHWTADGNRSVADILYAYLVTHPVLITK